MSKKLKKELLPDYSEWNQELLNLYDAEIAKVATRYKLETYPNQVEIISADQMISAYTSVGMPLYYNHWSFGKQFVETEKAYKRGRTGLAYEIVINSNPCISYLMEENTMTVQALVLAHACYGHNSFFKNNYMFNAWTNADAIIDYLVFARNYIADCEEKYGIETVEEFLDSCHALMNYGVDYYHRPKKISIQKEQARQEARADYLQTQVNELWRTLPETEKQKKRKKRFPEEPEDNLLYFIEKKSPLLKSWQRELIRIVRKMAQYFYPQKQTKVMNEGWATFWHYTIINTMYTEGQLSDKFMLEFIDNHTSVIAQPAFDSKYFSGINPYTLGFNMFIDIKRICENPTEEDKLWFPEIAGSDWLETLHFAMRNFKDESFIAQYLSPKVIRDMKFFSIMDDSKKDYYQISVIHNENGYQKIRQSLSNQYNLSMAEPHIQIYDVDIQGDRSLILRHTQHNNRPLDKEMTQEVLKHVYQLWSFPVTLKSIDDNDVVTNTFFCPEQESSSSIIE